MAGNGEPVDPREGIDEDARRRQAQAELEARSRTHRETNGLAVTASRNSGVTPSLKGF